MIEFSQQLKHMVIFCFKESKLSFYVIIENSAVLSTFTNPNYLSLYKMFFQKKSSLSSTRHKRPTKENVHYELLQEDPAWLLHGSHDQRGRI